MVKLRGYIKKLNRRSKDHPIVTFKAFDEEDVSRDEEHGYISYIPSTIVVFPMGADISLLNKTVENLHKYLEIEVIDGEIVDIHNRPSPFDEEYEDEKLDIDVTMTGRPKSLRDQLQLIMGIIRDLEKKTGMVPKAVILEKSSQSGITLDEAERLLGQLEREGTIYSPRKHYLKIT